MDKYYQILGKVLSSGKMQSNKKGNIRYLLNEQLTLLPADLLDIFEGHTIARKKLKNELQLFMRGERNVEKYREADFWMFMALKKAGSTIRIPRRRFLGTSPEVEKAVREIVEENLTEYFTIEYNIIRK